MNFASPVVIRFLKKVTSPTLIAPPRIKPTRPQIERIVITPAINGISHGIDVLMSWIDSIEKYESMLCPSKNFSTSLSSKEKFDEKDGPLLDEPRRAATNAVATASPHLPFSFSRAFALSSAAFIKFLLVIFLNKINIIHF